MKKVVAGLFLAVSLIAASPTWAATWSITYQCWTSTGMAFFTSSIGSFYIGLS
jgi:hypothetical protein